MSAFSRTAAEHDPAQVAALLEDGNARMALLAWFIFAPQCISTLAAARRETGGWGIPAAILIYLFALAYLASWLTYRISLYLFH